MFTVDVKQQYNNNNPIQWDVKIVKKGITSLKRLPIQIKMTGYSSLFKRLSVLRTTFVITYVSLADEALPKFEKILLLLLICCFTSTVNI